MCVEAAVGPLLPRFTIMNPKLDRLQRVFLITSGLMLVMTALAKLLTIIFFKEAIHDAPDWVFGVRIQSLLGTIALVELAVAASIFSGRFPRLNLGLVAFLSSQFLSYRFFTRDLHYCQCLGSVFQSIPLVGGNEWLISLSMAVFMLAGSLFLLLPRKALSAGSVGQVGVNVGI
jgi:hypothetical protein